MMPVIWGEGELLSKNQLQDFCLAQKFLKGFRAVNQLSAVVYNISQLCADSMVPPTDVNTVLKVVQKGLVP